MKAVNSCKWWQVSRRTDGQEHRGRLTLNSSHMKLLVRSQKRPDTRLMPTVYSWQKSYEMSLIYWKKRLHYVHMWITLFLSLKNYSTCIMSTGHTECLLYPWLTLSTLWIFSQKYLTKHLFFEYQTVPASLLERFWKDSEKFIVFTFTENSCRLGFTWVTIDSIANPVSWQKNKSISTFWETSQTNPAAWSTSPLFVQILSLFQILVCS